ncbi:chromate resistance protein ChrB domain-containing protein [Pseudomonas oryzihabitans]|uniref:Chromate resistance protein n=1 Tax=Pseudomonas oryzihabitans TaxID=47885 RepID=A0A178LDE3_9PSED|nr:chromate resistance protein ChrB domain-containing protein [Pseudomonas oryzihabitans]OAN28457.1 chromate resistance protein [Pseudomonas oryzihabitans]
MKWLVLVLSLPTENATARQRAWRSLKASGSAVLRDGVYLMPARDDCQAMLDGLASDVSDAGGAAYVLRVEEPELSDFKGLFERGENYALLLAEIARARAALTGDTVQDVLKQARKLRKAFATLAAIDFFPGEAQQQTDQAMQELELACARVLSPDEPHDSEGLITQLRIADYQGRVWATRQRPWVDRLASAWLIRRFVDPEAKVLWLASPAECPTEALGFDFDGAAFTHVGSRVTFEVLAASFGLTQPAISRLGVLVHYLDVGGIQPAEAVGIESVLAGLRATLLDDDQLLAAASALFDGLLASFNNEGPSP